jgi:hypothetical protein
VRLIVGQAIKFSQTYSLNLHRPNYSYTKEHPGEKVAEIVQVTRIM